MNFKITSINTPKLGSGSLITYRLKIHGFPVSWVTSIQDWHEGKHFVDFQCRGPYRTWHHTHRFHSHPDGVLMEDVVYYRLPMGWLGDLVAGYFVTKDVRAIFRHRREVIKRQFPA